MPVQVVNGAILTCPFGVAPSTFVVTPENRVLSGNQPAANIMDQDGDAGQPAARSRVARWASKASAWAKPSDSRRRERNSQARASRTTDSSSTR